MVPHILDSGLLVHGLEAWVNWQTDTQDVAVVIGAMNDVDFVESFLVEEIDGTRLIFCNVECATRYLRKDCDVWLYGPCRYRGAKVLLFPN